jgi:hypothetical protein
MSNSGLASLGLIQSRLKVRASSRYLWSKRPNDDAMWTCPTHNLHIARAALQRKNSLFLAVLQSLIVHDA